MTSTCAREFRLFKVHGGTADAVKKLQERVVFIDHLW